MLKRFLQSLVLAAALAPAAALADLNPGDFVYNPDLFGTGQAGSAGPYYTTATPAWVTGGALLASLNGPISQNYAGTVRSEVRDVGNGHLGFIYTVNITGPVGVSTGVVRVSHAAAGFDTIRVFTTGSDGSGASRARGGAVNWTDGDPYFIERVFGSGAVAWQFALGANGTEIRDGQRSARVWFETNATTWFVSETGLLDSGRIGHADILAPRLVPAPAAALLGLVGLGALGRAKRKIEG